MGGFGGKRLAWALLVVSVLTVANLVEYGNDIRPPAPLLK